jgi:hypothetical protein
MTFCSELCIELPDDFPVAEFTTFMAEARRVLVPFGTPSPAWTEFAGASNLIGWRYRASFDAWNEYRTFVKAYGDVRDHEKSYQQERLLFLMFSAGVSCVESTAYALAAAASDPTVCGIGFTTSEQRNCSPSRLCTWLSTYASAAQLVAALRTLVTATEWELWVCLRNRMTHRSNLPQTHYGAVGAPAPQLNPLNFAPTSSTPSVDADLGDWDLLHPWLAEQLRSLLLAGTAMLRGATPP